jgi:hypothetical protein
MNATDRIDYTRPFAENVRGHLYARFRLDADGLPQSAIEDRLYVYTIDIYLHSTRAGEIDRVEYGFGGVAPADALGQSRDRDNDFRETIESFGDTSIAVRVHLGSRTYEQSAWLSQMLENGHAKDMTTAIKAAILRIKVN